MDFAPKRERDEEEDPALPNDDNQFGETPKKAKSAKAVLISGGLVGLKVRPLAGPVSGKNSSSQSGVPMINNTAPFFPHSLG